MSVSLPKKILVAVDGSEQSMKAVSYATRLARLTGAKLLFLNVVLIPASSSPQMVEGLRRELMTKSSAVLTKSTSSAKMLDVEAQGKTLETDRSVVEAIVEFSERESADLIVLGSRGMTMGRLMLGSIAAGTTNLAHIPVLVVR